MNTEITNHSTLVRRYFGHLLSERELSVMWKHCFDLETSMLLGIPIINSITLDEWLCKRFNLDENLSMRDNLCKLIGEVQTVCFWADYKRVIDDGFENIKKNTKTVPQRGLF